MKTLYVTTCLVCLIALCGCGGPPEGFRIDSPGIGNPWTHLKFKNDPGDFQFLIVADRMGGYRPGVFRQAVEKVNLLQPEFVICVGDLIAGYTRDRAELKRRFDEFDKIVEWLEMPFFRISGNHDISNEVMAEVYRQRYSRPYYHYVYKNVLFLVVCTEDPPPSKISDEQVAYFARALAENRSVRWTCVFMHKPLFVPKEGKLHEGWGKIETMLKDRPHTVFAGHRHTYAIYRKHGRKYIRLATTGGKSKLRGPDFGQFDHVVWVTMTDAGPRIANLLLDGILDENVATGESISQAKEFLKEQIVHAGAVLCESETFSTATTKIHLSNTGKAPMTARGVLDPHPDLDLAPGGFGTTLLAGTTKTIPVKITAKRALKVDDLSCLKLR